MTSRQPLVAPDVKIASVPGSRLQRKCACGGDDERCSCQAQRPGVQRRARPGAPADPSRVAPPIVHDVLGTPGRPLDHAVRSEMEGRFGHDFSRVRVHTDSLAARSAQSVHALAYTVGQNIVFGSGQYALIVTADHGGHGRDHGSDDPRDVTIPWIAWGQGIGPAGEMQETAVNTFDTAPTILTLLGITAPDGWDGRNVLALH